MTARSGPGMQIKEPPGLRGAPTSETALQRIVEEVPQTQIHGGGAKWGQIAFYQVLRRSSRRLLP